MIKTVPDVILPADVWPVVKQVIEESILVMRKS